MMSFSSSKSCSTVKGKGQCYNKGSGLGKGSVSHVRSSGRTVATRASSVCVRGWPLQVGGGGCFSGSSVQGEMKRAIVASIAAGVLATAAPALAEDVVDPACVPQPVNGVSGLAYCDIKQGDGPKVVGLEEGDIVRVNFEARSKDEVADKARNFIFGLGSGESCPGFELFKTVTDINFEPAESPWIRNGQVSGFTVLVLSTFVHPVFEDQNLGPARTCCLGTQRAIARPRRLK